MDEKIIQLDVIRIQRDKPRKCTCDPRNMNFTVDSVNREVTCDCGQVVDPFDALENLAKYYERLNEQHKNLNAQRHEWIKQKPYSVLFKKLEQSYKRGTMLPSCPECECTFDFKDITFWTNSRFYRKLDQKRREDKSIRR